jgi:hypothetical protein
MSDFVEAQPVFSPAEMAKPVPAAKQLTLEWLAEEAEKAHEAQAVQNAAVE